MKLETIVKPEFQKALVKLMKSNLPIKTAYKLKGIIKTIAAEQQKYDKLRFDTIEKLADKNDDGTVVTTDDGTAKFTKDNYHNFLINLKELGSVDIDIPTIHISELEGLDESFSAQDFIYLDDLIYG